MAMGTEKRMSKLPRNLEVTMNGILLKQSNCETLLGCQVQHNLKWQSQVSSLAAKLVKRLNALSHIQYIYPYQIRRSIADGIFNSVLVYCLPLFGGMGVVMIRELQILQNKAARLVCRLPLQTSRKVLFRKLKWLTVNQLIWYHTLLSVFKIKISKEPEYLAKHFCLENRNQRIIVSNPSLSLAYESFCFRGSVQWNKLPKELREIASHDLFRRKLKEWIISNVEQFLE